MLKFHRKVNPKEGLIGFYKTGEVIDESTLQLYSYYNQLLKDPKNKGLLSVPLLFLIDPTMQNNRLTIKVSVVLLEQLACCFNFHSADKHALIANQIILDQSLIGAKSNNNLTLHYNMADLLGAELYFCSSSEKVKVD